MLHNFIMIAADTGMRPKEMFNLNWNHIEGLDHARQSRAKEARIRISAFGKGRNPAPLIPKSTVASQLLNIRRIYKFRFGKEPTAEMPVFCNLKGERITTFNKSLNALLDACDLRTDAHGQKFSSYSFRHYYATQALRDPQIDVYKLGTNMRTSVAMIERYYSDVIPEDHAALFRGDHEW
ncbi:tyrosine-type recombinase/integrase [Sulfitobacter sp. JBTF-M27]|uniref:Tyrosine-type recombinase/integrase n=1 Tax=Sulfitobacter sediminilitoris TaxID=2698830 RepID=A0A6P0CEV1_9RHOB|nr:tyrosine-type recombinase/integrase [Sulfitobacter sediminilitoris]NEK23738.1 tyrosine-type recombinase/integrase [Sulfitobacter sediminilitoris]